MLRKLFLRKQSKSIFCSITLRDVEKFGSKVLETLWSGPDVWTQKQRHTPWLSSLRISEPLMWTLQLTQTHPPKALKTVGICEYFWYFNKTSFDLLPPLKRSQNGLESLNKICLFQVCISQIGLCYVVLNQHPHKQPNTQRFIAGLASAEYACSNPQRL